MTEALSPRARSRSCGRAQASGRTRSSRTCSLRSPNASGWLPRVRWLVAKEWRELAASRPMLVFAICLGPLVGHAFATAGSLYGEASGAGGGRAALAQGLSPLDGIVVPTFGAYAIAAMLLFPFVAIRALASEKENGGLSLLLQTRRGLGALIS